MASAAEEIQTARSGKSAGFRRTEPVTGLNIPLGHGLDHGTDITPNRQGIA